MALMANDDGSDLPGNYPVDPDGEGVNSDDDRAPIAQANQRRLKTMIA